MSGQPQAGLLAVIEDHDGATETCECGAPAVCVGQFEGELLPLVCCDECCAHADFDECGRCWPLPTTSERARSQRSPTLGSPGTEKVGGG